MPEILTDQMLKNIYVFDKPEYTRKLKNVVKFPKIDVKTTIRKSYFGK